MNDQCVIIHMVSGWTLTRKLETSSLNMEFHQQNALVFDVHCLFVLALTLLFPWSKCSLGARVHDLWWCVLRHGMESLSAGFSRGLVGHWTLPHSQTVECFLTLF